MATGVRTTARVGQGASASSAGVPPTSAPTNAPLFDEGVEGCQPEGDSSSETDSAEEACDQDMPDADEQDILGESGQKGSRGFKPLKRASYGKTGDSDFEIASMLCFTGGFLKKPVVLDIKRLHDTDMMWFSGRAPWVNQAATGKVKRRGNFEKGATRVKEDLCRAMTEAAQATQAHKVAAAASGREALNVAEDSDSSGSSGDEVVKRSIIKVDNLTRGKVLEIQLEGLKFKAVLVNKRMYVEARADVAKQIVQACLTATLQVVLAALAVDAPLPPASEQLTKAGDQAIEGSRVDNPGDKLIRFDTGRSCYEAVYADDEGVKRRSIKGLYVQCLDKRGKTLAPGECDSLMTRAHKKAKRSWNQLDKSDRPRYTLQ